MQVKKLRHPVDGEDYLVVANQVVDGPSRLASSFSEAERAFVRALLEAIAADEDSALSSHAAFEVARVGAQVAEVDAAGAATGACRQVRLGAAEAERVLQRLSEDRWLTHRPGEKNYALGPRALAELRVFLGDLGGASAKTREYLRAAR